MLNDKRTNDISNEKKTFVLVNNLGHGNKINIYYMKY